MLQHSIVVLGTHQTPASVVDKISKTKEFTIIDVEAEAYIVDRFPVPDADGNSMGLRKPRQGNSYDWYRNLNPNKKRW